MRFTKFLVEQSDDVTVPISISLFKDPEEEEYVPRFAKRTYQKKKEDPYSKYKQYKMDVTIPSYIVDVAMQLATTTSNGVFKENRAGAVSRNTHGGTNFIRRALEVRNLTKELEIQIEQHIEENPLPRGFSPSQADIGTTAVYSTISALIYSKEKEWAKVYKENSPTVKKHKRPQLKRIRSFMRNKGYTLSDSQLQQIYKIIFDQ